MSIAEISISGFDDFDRTLAKLVEGAARAQIAAALNAGADVLVAEEKLLVPRRTGNLADSITKDMYPTNLPGDGMTIYIGPRTGPGEPDGWYGYLVEVGTERSPARPFARPAVDFKGAEAMGVVVSMLRADVLDMAA